MAKPANLNLNIRRGDTFSNTFTIYQGDDKDNIDITKTLDITGRTIKGMVRQEPDGPVWFELPITILSAIDGRFKIHMTAVETAKLTGGGIVSGTYDIQISWLVDGEEYVSTFITGVMTVSKDYTYKALGETY